MAQTLGQCLAHETRKQVSFRKDVYASVGILAQNWGGIKREIDVMITTRKYADFFDYMRSLKGLGTSQKSMLIKIPLIMRVALSALSINSRRVLLCTGCPGL